MIGDWQTYRLEDFIPFTVDVYLRLSERVNVAWWPLHFVACALGLAALALAWRGRGRLAVALLAPAWVASGVVFHLQRYAELNWAAGYFGGAFLGQAALLLALALLGRAPESRPGRAPGAEVGVILAVLGVVTYPLVAPVAGFGWSRAEAFALHPEPTAAVTLGVVLIALRGTRAWLAALLPVLWLAIGTATLVALDLPWAWVPPAFVALAAVGAAVGAVARRAHGSGS